MIRIQELSFAANNSSNSIGADNEEEEEEEEGEGEGEGEEEGGGEAEGEIQGSHAYYRIHNVSSVLAPN